jgi:hypothetical protein
MGTAGDLSAFSDPAAKDYYTQLLVHGLTDPAGALLPGAQLLPVENQFLAQAFGLNPTEMGLEATLQSLLGSPAARSPGGAQGGIPGAINPARGGDQGTPQGPNPSIRGAELPDDFTSTLAGASMGLGFTPLAPVGALGLAATPVAAAAEGLQSMFGPGVVGGPVAPQVGTGQIGAVSPSPSIDVSQSGRGFGGMGPGAGPSGGSDMSGVGTGAGEDMGAGMLHSGGKISEGEKAGTAQDVNKTLQEGEFVMSRAAVQAFGDKLFEVLNEAGKRGAT